MTTLVRPQRKTKPAHRQRRLYVGGKVLEVFSQEKPLPESVWQSVKRALGIKGKFIKASEK